MTLFQVGPRPNAVSCLLDPTRLPPGQMHCQPRILVGDRSLRAIGDPAVLRQLQDARQEAQNPGIQIDGVVTGGDILVRRVISSPRVPTPPVVVRRTQRATGTVARAALVARVEPTPSVGAVVLFETVIEGHTIQLTATP